MKLIRMLKSLVEKIIIISKEVFYFISFKPKIAILLHKNIPYYSQWESKDLVDKIVSQKIRAQDDPHWKRSGAISREEYALWSWNMCGMACLKMILADKYKSDHSTIGLGKKCIEYGGYTDNSLKHNTKQFLSQGKPLPLDYLGGLYYKPFLLFISKEFALTGNIISPMIVGDIVSSLSKNKYVIVSVNPNIREISSKPQSRGGHLVLITGYDLNQKRLYLHNPSGIYLKSQEHFAISFSDFNKFFANRGVVISS